MPQPNPPPEPPQPPLPLFRPEVLAAQQQKVYGEVLLIRPFSLSFFLCLGIVLAGAVIGLLTLGHYVGGAQGSSGHVQPAAAKNLKTK